jgi:hypothetical protein
MLETLEDQRLDWPYVLKSVSGQLLLLGDMSFFAAATLNAHLHFIETRNTDCTENMDRFSVITWTTVGYSLRVFFTAVFFISKVANLYRFISRKHSFPRIGAFYSPLMSTLMLSVIVYDFSTCTQISDIFSIDSAKKLISWYSILVIVFFTAVLAIYLVLHATHRTNRSTLVLVFKLIIGLLVVAGCTVGVVANLEMFKKRQYPLFSVFDMYSFLLSLVAGVLILIKRYREKHFLAPSQI